MKKIMTAAMIAASLALTMSVPAFAEEKHEASGPDSRSWQYEGFVEAGALPRGEDISRAKLGGNEGFILKEFGGVVFRVGVDTN